MNSYKPKVLIVEDDMDLRLMVGLYLQMEGLDVRSAEDGVQALESIRLSPPDILITDIDMPRKDGITLIKEIRQKEALDQALHELPVIAMSGGEQEKLANARQAGAAFVLSKPVLPNKLLDKIKELVKEYLIPQMPVAGCVG